MFGAILITAGTASGCSDTHQGNEPQFVVSQDDVNGSWTVNNAVAPASLSPVDYSWGPGIAVRNSSIDIDLLADEPTFRLGYLGGTFTVRSVERLSDASFRIVYWFHRGQFEVEWHMHFIDKDRAYFENIDEKIAITGIFGPENMHYKIDGPDIEDPPKRYDDAE